MSDTSISFFNRTINRLRQAWSEVSSSIMGGAVLNVSPQLSDEDLALLKQTIQHCLDAPSGEVSARNTAVQIGQVYLSLDETGRKRFFRLLATDFDADKKTIDAAIESYQYAKAMDSLPKLRHELRKALLAPRVELLTLFNALPEGIKFLVDMRAHLLEQGLDNDRQLKEVERDLKHLLGSWFDVGFLKLRQIYLGFAGIVTGKID